MLHCLSGNNGFYLFPQSMDEGFHRAFVASPTISSCLCVLCKDTSLTPRGEFLHDRNQHPVIPQPRSTFHLFLSQSSHSDIAFLSPSSTTLLPEVYTLPDPKQQTEAFRLAAFVLSLRFCFSSLFSPLVPFLPPLVAVITRL